MKFIWLVMVLMMITGCGGLYTMSREDRDQMRSVIEQNKPLILVVRDANEGQ